MSQVKIAPNTSFQFSMLRLFSKFVVLATLFLIFMGGQVKSHEAGLAVPDWPTTFGYNMFFYPLDQMVGGIFHEHVHRLIASGVGMLTIILTVWVWLATPQRWLRWLSVAALVSVIIQGILGGLTVRYGLPAVVSALHATLAQTFFLMAILIAYGLSREYQRRIPGTPEGRTLFRAGLVLIAFIYIQLILGAAMRHIEAGLAIPDFPTTAGRWLPMLDEQAHDWVNAWRFEQNADSVGSPLHPVSIGQMGVHLAHRAGALVVTAAVIAIAFLAYRVPAARVTRRTAWYLIGVIVLQVTLGILTIWSIKSPFITSMHVATGAAVLGLATLLAARAHCLSPDLEEAQAHGRDLSAAST